MRKNRLLAFAISSMIMPCKITNEDNVDKKNELKKLISDNEYKFEKPKSKYHK